MTDLILQSPGAGTNYIYVTDGVLVSYSGILMELRQYANMELVLHFEVPIKFSTSVRLSLTIGGSQFVYANATGWIEDE
jgi:hypothetical protein